MICKTTEQVINHVISVQMPHFLSCFLSLYSVCNCNMMKYQFSFVKIFLPLFWPDFKNMMNFYLHFGQERVNVGDCGVEHIGGQVVPNLKKCICVFCILVFCSLPQICICWVYTLRHLNTWADPSLIPGEMPEVWGRTPPTKSVINHLYKQILLSPHSSFEKVKVKRLSAHLSFEKVKVKKIIFSPLLASSPASRQSSWPRRGCTSMTTCNKVEIRIRSNKTLIRAPSPISHTRTTSTKFPWQYQSSDRKANYWISARVEIVPYQ